MVTGRAVAMTARVPGNGAKEEREKAATAAAFSLSHRERRSTSRRLDARLRAFHVTFRALQKGSQLLFIEGFGETHFACGAMIFDAKRALVIGW